VKLTLMIALLALPAPAGFADSVYPPQGTSKLNPQARYNLCVTQQQRQIHPVDRPAWERIYGTCGQQVYGVRSTSPAPK
jgi:hypothetical protein